MQVQWGFGLSTQTSRDCAERTSSPVTRQPAMGPVVENETCAVKLAQFFPNTSRIRIPVQVAILRPGAGQLHENTLVEFGAADHAIFASSLPLEFDDRVQLVPIGTGQAQTKGGKRTDATVIAVQYHEGRKAVAVRFLSGHCTWVSEP